MRRAPFFSWNGQREVISLPQFTHSHQGKEGLGPGFTSPQVGRHECFCSGVAMAVVDTLGSGMRLGLTCVALGQLLSHSGLCSHLYIRAEAILPQGSAMVTEWSWHLGFRPTYMTGWSLPLHPLPLPRPSSNNQELANSKP